VAGVAPVVADGVLHDPEEQQREPAELDVAADPVLAVVEDRSKTERALEVAPAASDTQSRLRRQPEPTEPRSPL
jgi:hypothetical protein